MLTTWDVEHTVWKHWFFNETKGGDGELLDLFTPWIRYLHELFPWESSCMDSLELHLQFEPMAPSWSLHGGKFHGTHDRTIEIASTKTM